MKKYGLARFFDDDLADWFKPVTFTYPWRTYDPERYELKPRQEYIDTLIKDKEAEIAYHEERIKELRGEKERLERSKTG